MKSELFKIKIILHRYKNDYENKNYFLLRYQLSFNSNGNVAHWVTASREIRIDQT